MRILTGFKQSVPNVGGAHIDRLLNEAFSPEESVKKGVIHPALRIVADACGLVKWSSENETVAKFFKRPDMDGEYNLYELVSASVHSMLTKGVAPLRVYGSGQTGITMRLLNTDHIQRVIEPDGKIRYEWLGVATDPIDTSDMCWIKDVPVATGDSNSRVEAAEQYLKMLSHGNRRVLNSFEHGIHVGVELRSIKPLEGEAFDEFKKRIEANFKTGGLKPGGLFFNDGGIEVKTHDLQVPLDPATQALLEAVIRRIAAILGIPAFLLGGTSDYKYSNIGQLFSHLYQDTIFPLVEKIRLKWESFFSMVLGTDVEITVDATSFQAGDLISQTNIAVAMVDAGIWSIVRALEFLGEAVPDWMLDDEKYNRPSRSNVRSTAIMDGSRAGENNTGRDGPEPDTGSEPGGIGNRMPGRTSGVMN